MDKYSVYPNKVPICYIKSPAMVGDVQGVSRAVIYHGKTWDVGYTLRVAFIGGSKEEIDFVKKIYKELDFINLNFEFVTNAQNSDVRWSFVKGGGSWSYLGTDALFISKTEPTVNIGWAVAEDVVRHELGHSLGLAHEHQNPSGGIDWNRTAVIKALSGAPNYWSVAQIESNVLNALKRESVDYTEFDMHSVMLYSFPAEWTNNNIGTPFNSKYSEKDKDILKKYYPKQEVVEVEIDNTLNLLKDLFPMEKKMDRLTEPQLMYIAEYLKIPASVNDLKRDTIKVLFNYIHK